MAVTMDQIKARRAQLEQGGPLSPAARDSSPEKGSLWQGGQQRNAASAAQPLQAPTRTGTETGGVTMKAIQTRRAQLEQGMQQYAAAFDSYRAGGQMGKQSAVAKWGTPETVQRNVLTEVGRGAQAYGASAAQKQKLYNAEHRQEDDFDRLNQWRDSGDHQNLADAVRRVDGTHGMYTDRDLIEKGGWTQEQIDEARQMNAAQDAIPKWKRAVRRTANTVGGIADMVAAAPVFAWETAAQAKENLTRSAEARKTLEAEVAKDPRQKSLYERMQERDMDYQPKYSVGDLLQQGYTRAEIEAMQARIDGTEVQTGLDPEQSLGYQLFDQGRQLTAAAQSGLTPAQRIALGVVSSAGENLVVGAMSPAAVLPILSAQGAAEAMGQSVDEGQSAGRTLAGGVAKFGAGWAINSVGAADLARTMGSDYAKDTLAGKMADWVRGMAGDSEFAQQYPAVANAVSGGIDNAMQAFAETYADKAIDAALGDAEAAQTLFDRETFLEALESGLSGGASGALGGAAGSGLGAMREKLEALGADESHSVLAQEKTISPAEPLSPAARDSSPEKGSLWQGGEQQRNAQADGETAGPTGTAVREDSLEAGSLGRQSAANTEADSGNAEKEKRNAQYSIREDETGKAYVQIDKDLLEGVPQEQWTSTVRDAIRDLFPNGFERDGAPIANTREGRNEFTHSKSTKALQRENAETYQDKLRMTGNLDEIVSTSDDVRGEAARHKNGESFNRAKINIRVGARDYSADVLTAIKKDGHEVFYDVVNLEPTKIKASAGTAEESTSGSKSTETMERTGESDAGIAVPDGKRHPDLSETSIAPAGTAVNEESVEKSGEGVENRPEEMPLQETVGLREGATREEKVHRVEQTLRHWDVSEKGAQSLSRNLPKGTDTEVYAAAASSLYRLGQMEDVDSFEKALELAGTGNHLGLNVAMVLEKPMGRNALELAYLQGRGEQEARAQRMGRLGGSVGEESLQGSGRTRLEGTLREAEDPARQLIALNAAGTGTDAVLKNLLEGPDGGPDRRVKARVDTETAKIYFGDGAEDAFGTVLHEDFHWYNALDPEGAKTVLDHVLLYLAKNSGYEGIDEMIHARMKDYAAQNLTYEQAAEELAADAWRGIFDSEESFGQWVKFQQAQAEKNAGRAGTIHRVMERVKELLDSVLSKAKELLQRDPENAAARKAKRLAEAEKRVLREEYFDHADRAMENLRAAKENAAAPGREAAAEKQKVRFSICQDANGESYVKIDEDILNGIPQEKWKSTVKQAIKERYPEGFERNGWKILNHKEGRNEFVWSKSSKALQWENAEAYADKMRMAANLDEIIRTADEVYREPANHKNAEAFNRGKIRILVGENFYEADVLTAIKADEREIFYDVVRIRGIKKEPSGGTHVEPEGSRSRLPESSNQSIAQREAESKKTVRFQLAEEADREARKDPQRQASRTIAQRDAALKTLTDFFGITRGVRISDDSLEGMALRIINTSGAKGKMKAEEFAKELRPLVEYMKADGADMSKAESMAEVLAGEVLEKATYRDTELWDQYPELHALRYTVEKGGKAEQELARRYGSWSEAVKEARSHGVQLRRETGARDGNPAEQYESIVNDTRAVGGGKDGMAALFRTAAKKAGVDGAASMEASEWLEVLMNVRDTIRPRILSRYADAAEYEDARVELAGRMLGEAMKLNEMTDAESIFEGIQKHNRAVAAAAAAGSGENAAEAMEALKKVQKAQRKEFGRQLRANQRAEEVAQAIASRSGRPLSPAEPLSPAARDSSPEKGSLWQGGEQQRNAQAGGETAGPTGTAVREDSLEAGSLWQGGERQRNAQAEKLLDENLELLGVDVSSVGDLSEKLEVLRETYEREWKAEQKRMRDERRQMLDDIALERKQWKAENRALARQVAGEQKRADRAEYQLIVQENEIMEWEDENQRKAEAWQQKQAQRNAMAIEVARQQRDEDVAVAKALAEKRVQKVREGRQRDELRRSIQRNAAQLNQMVLRPSPGKYVSQHLIVQAAEVAKLADLTTLNFKAVQKLEALRSSVKLAQGSEGSASGVSVDWEKSGVANLIETLEMDLTAAKQAKLDHLNAQLTQAEALPDSEKTRSLQDRLKQRIRETEARVFLPLTVDQMRMLNAITSSTLHVIRTANRTLSLKKAQEVAKMAETAAGEVRSSTGNRPGGKGADLRRAMTRYNLDMLGGERVLRMLGGYTHGGVMEQLGQMLNEGQRKQTEILVNGEARFENVTGPKNRKKMEKFAGPGAELVDMGLTDTKGQAVRLTHAQLCSLYMHLQNEDSREHLLRGGMTLPDAELYHKGNIEGAFQQGQTVLVGNLADKDGTPLADTILQKVEAAMDDYDRAWCADMKEFFGKYTTDLINETSLKLVGYQRATVKNYYPIAVDKTQLATEIEGLKHDATIEGRGFLKNRQKSGLPILLEECSSVVQRSLRDTAAYAGLAAPIRDVQKVLNSLVETKDGVGVLKNKIIREQWGSGATDYIDELLTDLQSTGQRTRKSSMSALGKLRSRYAGAVLTLNPGVAIAQAASLPTAGAVLGADTMAAVVPFVKNLSARQRAALEAEIEAHGDVLLRYRKRGSQEGELSSMGRPQTLAEKGMDRAPKWLTGWISGMDEVTVAALWEGAKRYVEHHPEEIEGYGPSSPAEPLSPAKPLSPAARDSSPEKGSLWQGGEQQQNAQAGGETAGPTGAAAREDSLEAGQGEEQQRETEASGDGKLVRDEAYWAAVNAVYQRVIEQTQPNYTVMQRAGIQRSDSELARTLTMFTTQRFQNYGIVADAVGDYRAQAARYRAEASEANRAEVDRAKAQLDRAVTSQLAQTAVFALMKMGADFLLHRWDREQDENGDITGWSLLKRFWDLFAGSAAGNFLYGSEAYSAVTNVIGGKDYDVVSAASLSAVNDLAEDTMRFYKVLHEDTREMDEEALAAHEEKWKKAFLTLATDGLELKGLPAGNAVKLWNAVEQWGQNLLYEVTDGQKGEKLSFHALPASATGQYDRLYDAIQRGDPDEARAALDKLDAMGKSGQVNAQLKTRLKRYDDRVERAAKAQNAGKPNTAFAEKYKVFEDLRKAYGVKAAGAAGAGKADAEARERLIDLVNGAVNEKAEDLYTGGTGGSVYDALHEALDSGRAAEVQKEMTRLRTAGKETSKVKTEITKTVKPEYLAGNEADRAQMARMLLALEDGSGNALYKEKDLERWVTADEKEKEAAAQIRDEWEGVR